MSTILCSVPECTKPARCRGLCHMHYTRLRRNGHTDLNPNWSVLKRGIPYLNLRGYMELFSVKHGRKVRLHRYIMEKHLGRPLKPTEIVHHKNGNRLDNRIENLQLIGSSSTHLASHSREYWATRRRSSQYQQLLKHAKKRVKRFGDLKRGSRYKHVGVKCFCGRQAHVFGMCKTHYAWAFKRGLTK